MSEVDKRLNGLFAYQEREGTRMLSDPQYSSGGHNVGEDVMDALEAARRAVREIPVGTQLERWARFLDAIVRAHHDYRLNARDVDGYGSATFHEIRRGLADARPPGPPTEDEEQRAALEQLVAAGDRDAMFVRGIDLLGEDTSPFDGPRLRAELDAGRARELLEAAAARNHAGAQYHVGLLCDQEAAELERSIWERSAAPAKREEARAWYQKAAAQGHAGARDKLAR